MKGFIDDCKYALRLYRRAPAASLTAIAGLAIAMATVAAFVSLYVDLVLRAHAGFADSNRIVTFGRTDGSNIGGLSQELIDRIAEEATTLEAAAGVSYLSFFVGPDRERVAGEVVTREFFAGLRPRLVLGRGFELAEHATDGAPVVVTSYAYWRQQFDGPRACSGLCPGVPPAAATPRDNGNSDRARTRASRRA